MNQDFADDSGSNGFCTVVRSKRKRSLATGDEDTSDGAFQDENATRVGVRRLFKRSTNLSGSKLDTGAVHEQLALSSNAFAALLGYGDAESVEEYDKEELGRDSEWDQDLTAAPSDTDFTDNCVSPTQRASISNVY